MILQPIIDLVELCHRHGVSRVVISPGSRSAALTLAFTRNNNISCTVVMDERAAGFIALGMAQQLRQPVALVCTSGSAAYNFAPAVAEAYFQQIPLVVLTADRPPEWINQNDGQTIFQENIYGKHVKQSTSLPADYTHPDSVWYINRVVNESLLGCQETPMGPVHLNVPIREPFYPNPGEIFTATKDLRVIKRVKTHAKLDDKTWQDIRLEWKSSARILIAAGQMVPSVSLQNILGKFSEMFDIPLVGDTISNVSNHGLGIAHQDLIFQRTDTDDLIPDLLITIGQSFISKKIKRFLQKNPVKTHWHVSEDLHVIDTFFSLTNQIPMDPVEFFNRLFEDLNHQAYGKNWGICKRNSYLASWVQAESGFRTVKMKYLKRLTVLNDITAVNFLVDNLRENNQIQVANSMSVRYLNVLGIEKGGVSVYCNRGTSGIDGCVSTAIGSALVNNGIVYLLVGDVAFFYDRNGLLIKDLPGNLKIVLLNNSGGTIFRMIDGPASQPELETYFETKHRYDARLTAEDCGLSYYLAEDLDGLKTLWEKFNSDETAAILEMKTDAAESVRAYKELLEYCAKT